MRALLQYVLLLYSLCSCSCFGDFSLVCELISVGSVVNINSFSLAYLRYCSSNGSFFWFVICFFPEIDFVETVQLFFCVVLCFGRPKFINFFFCSCARTASIKELSFVRVCQLSYTLCKFVCHYCSSVLFFCSNVCITFLQSGSIAATQF